MFVICKGGHLGMFWKIDGKLFLEKESAILRNRKECVNYLADFIGSNAAVDAVVLMQKTPNTWYSF